jgi:hypothetical protein
VSCGWNVVKCKHGERSLGSGDLPLALATLTSCGGEERGSGTGGGEQLRGFEKSTSISAFFQCALFGESSRRYATF